MTVYVRACVLTVFSSLQAKSVADAADIEDDQDRETTALVTDPSYGSCAVDGEEEASIDLRADEVQEEMRGAFPCCTRVLATIKTSWIYNTATANAYFDEFVNSYKDESLSKVKSTEQEKEQQRKDIGAASEDRKKASMAQCVLTLFKGMIGSGVLFLPKAYEQGGLYGSNIAMFVIYLLSIYCIVLLVEIRRSPAAVKAGSPLYGDLAGLTLGESGRYIVDASIVLSQLGVCCCYMIFISDNVRQSLMLLTTCQMKWAAFTVVGLQGLTYVPLSWVRRIHYFGLSSLFADVLIVVGLCYIFGVTVTEEQVTPPVVKNWNLAEFPMFLGTAVYTFEGIGLVVPIFNSMKPELRPKFNTMVIAVFTGCLVLVSVFASFVYMSLGERVQTVITKELPHDVFSSGTVAVQLAYSLALMLTYPIQIYPAICILEKYLIPYSSKDRPEVKWHKNFFRAVVVAFTVLVATACSANITAFVAFLGGTCCVPLAFIYPALMHCSIPGVQTKKWQIVVNYLVAIVGGLFVVFCTYLSIVNWKSEADTSGVCPLAGIE
jgi:proton-coupled amino acid transporter